MMLIILILIGVAIYFVINEGNVQSLPGMNRKAPEEILKERFVKGEIDEETYKKMMDT